MARVRTMLQIIAVLPLLGVLLAAQQLHQASSAPAVDRDGRITIRELQNVITRQPTHFIGLGSSMRGVSAIAVDPQSPSVYALQYRDAINVWALLAAAWPEFAAGVLALVAGACMLRLLRRRRFVGEPHCPACGYCLKGIAAEVCPECGADLRTRTLVIGSPIRARLVISSCVLIGALGAYGGWLRTMPRAGAFSNWQEWWSTRLYDFALGRNIDWLQRRGQSISIVTAVDSLTGKQRIVHSSGLHLGRSIVMNPDGSEIAAIGFERGAAREPTTRLVLINPSTGSVRAIHVPKLGWTPVLLSYSSAGEEVFAGAPRSQSVVAVNVTTGDVRTIESLGQRRRSDGTLGAPPVDRAWTILRGSSDRIAIVEPYGPLKLVDAATGAAQIICDDAPSFPVVTTSPVGMRLCAFMDEDELWDWSANDLSVPSRRFNLPVVCWMATIGTTVSGRQLLLLGVKGPGAPSGEAAWIVDLESGMEISRLEIPAGTYPIRCEMSADARFVYVLALAQSNRTWELLIYDVGDVVG